MAEVSGDGGGLATPAPLSVSGSFKEGRGSSRRRGSARPPSMDADEFMNLLHGSDPVKVELNRLQNEVRDKDRELSEAQDEIKALRNSKYGIVLEAHAVAIQTCVAANGRRRPRRIVRTTDSFTDVEKKKFQELLKGDEFYRIRLPSNVLLLRLLPSQFQHDNIVRYYGSDKVSEVKGVMMENIEKVLDRGEKIELLVNKTDSLHHQAQDFKSSGTTIRQKMWLQNMKQPPFDKKQFVAYVKRYIKLLTPKLEPEKQELFKKHIEGATKFLLSKLSDLQLWEPRC